MGVRDLIREGAADFFGFGDELEHLRESNSAALALARRVEDIGWTDIGVGMNAGYFDPDRQKQKTQTKRAYTYFFNDPIVKRSVLLRTYYTYANGMPRPTYREDKSGRAGTERVAEGSPEERQRE